MEPTNPDEENELIRRRNVRKNYRELNDAIHDNRASLSDVRSEEFQQFHAQANEYFAEVNNVREVVIDSKTVLELAKGLRSQAFKMGDIASSFNFPTFSTKLQERFSDKTTNEFSWTQLGHSVGALFASAPLYRFSHSSLFSLLRSQLLSIFLMSSVMLGPLAQPITERKASSASRRRQDQVSIDTTASVLFTFSYFLSFFP
jgi:hypothetical protein